MKDLFNDDIFEQETDSRNSHRGRMQQCRKLPPAP